MRKIVVFDLDVTLTRYDTFLPFVFGYLRQAGKRHWLSLWRLPVYFSAFWHWGDRTWTKNNVFKAALLGQSQAKIDAWAERFADLIVAKAMRESGLNELRRHQQQGARVILASASFDIYVKKIGQRLGIKEVLGTRVQWDAQGRLLGMLGENCRDEEKLRRVKKLLKTRDNGDNVTAYSDSHADLPLLTWAENGVAVCPSKRLFHQLGGLGLDVAHW